MNGIRPSKRVRISTPTGKNYDGSNYSIVIVKPPRPDGLKQRLLQKLSLRKSKSGLRDNVDIVNSPKSGFGVGAVSTAPKMNPLKRKATDEISTRPAKVSVPTASSIYRSIYGSMDPSMDL